MQAPSDGQPAFLPPPGDLRPYPHLRSPAAIGPLALGHRILMGAMHLGLEGPDADVERLCAFYAARAAGGAALLFSGGVAVVPEGAGEGGHYFVFGRSRDETALAAIAAAVHGAGGRLVCQLFHAGRYARSAETGLQPVAPSAVPSRLNAADPPRALAATELPGLAAAYGAAARRCRELGFDGVEVMGSEGYLLNEFLAPLTNRRTDAYGGDAEGRRRLPLLVTAAVREALGPDLALVYRLSGADLIEGGTPWAEVLGFAAALAHAGADALDVGIGWHESTVPTVGMLVPRAAFAAVARGIRQAVNIPVIAANRINTPEVAERVLASGAADFVALARPFLADPDFARKALEGRARRINTCIACNQACLDHVLDRPARPASCLVNPGAGREREMAPLPAAVPLAVTVVGGGPAGLEAARVLAVRGHTVTLLEREAELGGQLRHARRVPGKGEFEETLRYYREELTALGVRLVLGRAAAPADLAGAGAVVLACGVRPRIPTEAELPGVGLPHVVTYPQVFSQVVPVGRRVAIIGAGGIGCDLAHFLSEGGPASPEALAFLTEQGVEPPGATGDLHSGREITLMRRGARIGPLLGRTTRWAVLATLRRRGVRLLTGVRYRAITPTGVEIEVEGRSEQIAADTVVLACGQEPAAPPGLDLPVGVPLHVIGGMREAGELDAERAILEGARIGLAL